MKESKIIANNNNNTLDKISVCSGCLIGYPKEKLNLCVHVVILINIVVKIVLLDIEVNTKRCVKYYLHVNYVYTTLQYSTVQYTVMK
jgi:hypothetical protein